MDKKQENFERIAEMCLSEDHSDIRFAIDWMIHLVGEKNAMCNLLLLSMYKQLDEETGGKVELDEHNYWSIIFEKIDVPFTQDHFHYIGQATMVFDGKNLLSIPVDMCSKKFTLQQIKMHFYKVITIFFHRDGVKFYPELFDCANKLVREVIK